MADKIEMALQIRETVYSENFLNYGLLTLNSHKICKKGFIAPTFFVQNIGFGMPLKLKERGHYGHWFKFYCWSNLTC